MAATSTEAAPRSAFTSEISGIGQQLLEELESFQKDATKHGDLYSDASGDELDLNFEDPEKRELQIRCEALEVSQQKLYARLTAIQSELVQVSKFSNLLRDRLRFRGLDLPSDVRELQRMVALLQAENAELKANGGKLTSETGGAAGSSEGGLEMDGKKVSAGSVAKLLEHMFSKSSDMAYVQEVILTYQHFCKGGQLLDAMESAFTSAGEDKPRQTKVFTALKMWIEKNPHEIKADTQISTRVAELVSVMGASSLGKAVQKTLTTSLTNMQKVYSEVKTGQAKGESVSFKAEKADLIAKQLTLIHYALFKMITPGSLLKYKTEVLLLKKTSLVTVWIKNELSKVKKTGSLVKKFIEIAEWCRQLHNFNASFAIIEGLAAHGEDLAKKLPSLVKKFPELQALVDETGNYKNYQEVIKKQPRPCVPYFKFYVNKLNNIIKMPNDVEGPDGIKFVNFDKFRLLAAIGTEILFFQDKDYKGLERDDEILAYLSVFGAKAKLN